MAHLLSGERTSVASFPGSGALKAVLNWAAKARTARRQRRALSSLLELEETRLDDLGINRQDLFEALDQGQPRPGAMLARRRATRSRLWLDP